MYALDTDAWTAYFASIDVDRGALASVSLLSGRGRGGGGHSPQSRTLRGIRYDRDHDLLQVGVGGTAQRPALRYFIRAPRRIVVEESADGREIAVYDAERAWTAITVRAARARAARLRAR